MRRCSKFMVTVVGLLLGLSLALYWYRKFHVSEVSLMEWLKGGCPHCHQTSTHHRNPDTGVCTCIKCGARYKIPRPKSKDERIYIQ